LRIEWSTSDEQIERYARMPLWSSPPIVFDPIDNSIIDGTHRAVAAERRGDETIPGLRRR
jgi:hypothetical protein